MNEPSSVDPAISAEFYSKAGHIPSSAEEWTEQQAVFRCWRVDQRFQPYWEILDGLLAKDFEATRPWAAAARAAQELRESGGYDFDAWRDHSDYDLKHAHDHLP